MSQIEVERWGFWSPESDDPSLWLSWWRANAEPARGDPCVDPIPAVHRRRMSRLSKMALSTTLQVVADSDIDFSIFCSQHGEIIRTRQILGSIASATEISPTAFSQSVHNTSSGLYTIIRSSNAPSMSLASGTNTFAYGWLEAQAYLYSNPAHRVLLVDFDEVVPEDYQPYTSGVDCDHSLALLLRAAVAGGIRMSPAAAATETELPLGPQFLAWLQSSEPTLSLASDGQRWQWER